MNIMFQIEKVKVALSEEVLIIEDLISGHQDIIQKLSSRTLVSFPKISKIKILTGYLLIMTKISDNNFVDTHTNDKPKEHLQVKV